MRLTPDTSNTGFAIGLYLEHLEEASFLYEQRLSLLVDPELNWLDLQDFEERFEAHIDALVVGEELALEVCRQQTGEGDFGELHAAVRVFCRQDRIDLFHEVVELLDPEDDERLQATADALCHELPTEWQRAFEEDLARGQPILRRLAARALGYRRIPASGAVLGALGQGTAAAAPDLIWTLGRLRDSQTRAPLFRTFLQQESSEIQSAAALALLRIGEPATIKYCAGIADAQPWALVPLALGGNRSHIGVLMKWAASETVNPTCLLALGLLGEIAAVDPLLYHLGNEALAEEAAMAMHMITGAELFEDVFIPEENDEDDLFENELDAAGEAPEAKMADDGARGTTITRLSQQPDVWMKWWGENKPWFMPGVRYRLGKPYSPEGLLHTLAAERSPHALRQLAAEELVIRYGCNVPLEVDAFVAAQLTSLAGVKQWLSVEGRKFEEGRYYFAGRPQTA